MTRSKNSSTPDGAVPPRPVSPPQETLVVDARAGLTPSQLVERKLVSMLRSTLLPASHLQVSRMRRALS
jgi:hypothetical protein